MKLKTYTAVNMSTALALVKSDLGSDAVILHTRTYRKRVFFGLGAHQVVEITASDGAEINRRRDQAKRKTSEIASLLPGDMAARGDTNVEGVGAARGVGRSDSAESAGPSTQELIRRTYSAARASMGSPGGEAGGRSSLSVPVGERVGIPVSANGARGGNDAGGAGGAGGAVGFGEVAGAGGVGGMGGVAEGITLTDSDPEFVPNSVSGVRPGSGSGSGSGPVPLPVPVGGSDAQLAEEMRAVKRMVSRMAQKQDGGVDAARRDLPDQLFDQYLALLEQEVAEELAREVIGQVESVLDDEAMQESDKVKEAMRVALAALIPIDPDAGKVPDRRPGRPAGPCKIALIGPTGVGKTTTIAKLAADLKLKQGKKVGMITLDTYRIAAVDQLQTYANIIGVPLYVASNESELSDVVSRCGDLEVVLIDTAGRSQRDDPRLEQLQKFVEIADPDQVHLVLSSTCSQKVLLETAERFSKTRVDRVIFTKLDEAVSFGVLLNVARKVNKNLSYLTTGQEVPHQIEPGGSERLAALVMGEGV